jgi:hypothetical protein
MAVLSSLVVFVALLPLGAMGATLAAILVLVAADLGARLGEWITNLLS